MYGERDQVDLQKLRDLQLPFWLAGEYRRPDKVREALATGAAGVRLGTVFTFCDESGLSEEYKNAILKAVAAGQASVLMDPVASPTNFPFKIVRMEGSASEPGVYSARPRICDLGFLCEAYRTSEGTIG